MTFDNDEVWVSNYRASDDTLGNSFTVDSAHDVSLTRQLQFGPAGRFFLEFNGAMYAANVLVNGVRYRDRLYKSSGLTGAISFARSAQTDVDAEVTLTDQVPTMTSDTTPLGVSAASASAGAGNEAFRAFDDDISTGGHVWAPPSGTTTGWVRYDFGSGNSKIITYYSVTGISAAETVVNVGPKDWTLEGSNDASSWTVLHTVASTPVWVAGEKRIYTVSNTTLYRYYRMNVSANQGNASILTVAELELLTSSQGVKALKLEVDSARYLKSGMHLDVYKAGTGTKLFDITINTVDMANDFITFVPYTLNFTTGDVNTSTEVITLSDATKFPTGTAIKFDSTSSVPAGLTANTIYYSIFVSSTTIKVASSLANAQLGVAINLTSTGAGTMNIRLSYIFGNKDELWGFGRKGKLTRYWNVDYRNPEDADWTKLPPTLDAVNDITAIGKLSGRMFWFTESAMIKFDGQNRTPLYNDVGCISAKSLCYYQSFMVWLDAKGQIWIRNEEAGQQDVISEPIRKTLNLFTQDQLKTSSAVCVGKKYKLKLGLLDDTYLRIVYDFQTNQWTKERFSVDMPIQFETKYSSVIKPHFFDQHGKMWVDETGNDDDGSVIPFDVSCGDDNFGVDENKKYIGIKVYGRNVAGTKVKISVDGGEWIDIGQLEKPVQSLSFEAQPKGTMINVRFVNSSSGDPVEIHKATVYYNREEDTFRATK